MKHTNEEEKLAKIVFEYTDEFGDRTRLERDFDMVLWSEDSSHLDVLRDMFDKFLISAGFVISLKEQNAKNKTNV